MTTLSAADARRIALAAQGMARWLGLPRVAIAERGDLATPLARATRARVLT